jgi:hypothetical protein
MFVRVKTIGGYASSPPPRGTPAAIVLSSFNRGELVEVRRRSIGSDLVFGHLWRETGCQAVLRRHVAGRRFASTPSARST